MPRPDRKDETRARLLPVVAGAFAELGYRRTTTAELAARCGVRENVLYRLWPDKRAMFLAAVDHVFGNSERIWRQLLQDGADGPDAWTRLLEHEAKHHGESRLYRIVFAGLSETDDNEIRAGLRRMYRRFHAFIVERLVQARAGGARSEGLAALDPDLAAWMLVGLGTVANIGREVGLFDASARRALLLHGGARLAAPDKSATTAGRARAPAGRARAGGTGSRRNAGGASRASGASTTSRTGSRSAKRP